MQPEDQVALPANMLRASGIANMLCAILFLLLSSIGAVMSMAGGVFLAMFDDPMAFFGAMAVLVIRYIPSLLLSAGQLYGGWWIYQSALSLDLLDDRKRIQTAAIAAIALPGVVCVLETGMSVVTMHVNGCCTTLLPITPVLIVGAITTMMVMSVLSNPEVSQALEAD